MTIVRKNLRQLNYLIGAPALYHRFSFRRNVVGSLEEFHERYDLYLLDIFMEGISGLN